MSKTLNSSAPTTAELVGGVYNAGAVAPVDGQALPLQLDSAGNLKVNIITGGGGGSSNINIANVAGSPPAITNPLPVELSDGTNPLGTITNPLYASFSGSAGNAAAGPTGSAVPNSADYLGFNVAGNLVGVSSVNALPVTGTITAVTSITNPVAVTGTFFQATQPVSGTVSISGTVGVTQSTSPWVVSLTSTTITGTVAVTQSTSPWVVSNSGTFAVQASITTLGQQLAAASVPVVLTAAQLSTLTPLSTVAVTQSTSPWVVSLTSTTITGEVTVNLNQVGGVAFALGQQLAASSLPVVLTASQLSTLTPLTSVAVTNTGTFAVQASISTLGQQLAAASVPVVLTAAQLSTLTPLTTVAVTQSTSPWVENLNQVGGAAFALGQQLAASSLPVVLTASQISTLTPLTSVAVTNVGTFAVQSASTDNLTQVGGAAFALGQQLAAASLPVVLTASQLSTLTPLTTVAVTQSTNPWAISAASLPLPTGASTDANLVSGNDLAQQTMLILECMRRALIALACEGGRNNPRDFDPTIVSQEEGVDDYAD
jgi:hypothetical protein